ncbi:MAG: hypothetical protein WD491_08980 [Balneolales bacterium]
MKKTILKMISACMFVALLSFNITTTTNSLDFSLGGMAALASGTTCDESTDPVEKNWNQEDADDPTNCEANGAGCINCTN